ncbi:MAG TPA: YqiA/YcfP family alpha/beta fold hydrolase [Bryobacteraceae bacterium]
MAKLLRVVYLHGFASSPRSRKALFFADKLAALGFSVEIPDLAQGDFLHLTISNQLQVVERAARGEPLLLIGSSMGGYLAALYAARHPEVDRLILLAPAFRFHELWTKEFGPERLRLWKEKGSIPIFHYGEQGNLLLGYQLMEDAAHFEAFPDFSQSCLLFHGSEDPLLPVSQSAAFAAAHPNVRFIELLSGHELTDVLDDMWDACRKFLVNF